MLKSTVINNNRPSAQNIIQKIRLEVVADIDDASEARNIPNNTTSKLLHDDLSQLSYQVI